MTSSTNILPQSVFNRPLNAGDLGCMVLVAFFIAALPISEDMSISGVLNALTQQNIFVDIAVLVAIWRYYLARQHEQISRKDVAIASIAMLLFAIVCFVGVWQLAGLALTFALLPVLFIRNKSNNLISALILAATLAMNSFWAPLIFQTFTSTIIALDTSLLAFAYKILRPDIVAKGATFATENGFGIVVVGICSVFSSASIVLVAAAAFTQYLRAGFARRDLVVVLILLSTMIAINTARLVLMGWNRASFAYWHEGAGGPYIAAAQTLVIAAIAAWGASWASRQKA